MLVADPEDEGLVERARFLNEKLFLTYDCLLGRIDGRHPLVGYLQAHGMTDAELDWHQRQRGSFDYMGVNFYPHLSVHELYRGKSTSIFGSHQGDIAQRGLWVRADRYEELMRIYWRRYGIPIVHTESSSVGEPAVLIDWLEDSLAAVKRLRAEGVRLEGYTWWPLFDLIDWEYRNGAGPAEDYLRRMGLWQLEMGIDGTFQRVSTEAVERFKAAVAGFDPGPVDNA
jgi:beta-glucosidase/6-phospho-beta-glucosidase/beta-galactosidase